MSTRAPKAQTSTASRQVGGRAIELVVFSLYGLRFAVESAQVRGISDGDNANVPALAELLQIGRTQTRTPPGRERLLRLRLPSQDGGESLVVRVEEPITLRRLQAVHLRPLPWIIAANSVLPCLRALALPGDAWADDLTILLDVRRLPGVGAEAEDPQSGHPVGR